MFLDTEGLEDIPITEVFVLRDYFTYGCHFL